MIYPILKDKIKKEGPLRLDRFIDLALYHPEFGYYRTTHPVGKEGDFVTSPEICSLFGELIGLFFLDYWEQSESPLSVKLIELGPGKGTLAKDILTAFKRRPQIFEGLTIHLVEVSESLTALQKDLLKGFTNVYWHTSLEDVPDGFSLIIGNEFFDALPIRQFLFKNKWLERYVTFENERDCLSFTEKETSYPFASISETQGRIIEISEASQSYADIIGKRLKEHNGIGLFIDYGTERIPWGGDSLQAMKHHQYVDILAEPGQADITHHVDFFSLKQQFQKYGLITHGTISQSQFLTNLGIGLRAQQMSRYLPSETFKNLQLAIFRLISPEFMGQLFKVFAVAKNINLTPAGFNGTTS